MSSELTATASLIPQSDSATERATTRWSPFARVAFRFGFCYLLLYCLYMWDGLSVLLRYFAATRQLTRMPQPVMAPLWHRFVPWVGQHVLHLPKAITVFSNGSGDTTYDYVLVLCFLAISTLGSLVWSLLDRRSSYQTLHQWLRLAVAATLAAQMLSYGINKVIPLQFGYLSFDRLSEPLGEMTPIMLLWNFMAASKPYTIAVGMVEVLGGVLLFVPRLTTLGALISLASMANVFALNMSYDVPVKLLSFHMGLLAVFLLIPELPRLANVFVLNRAAEPLAKSPLSEKPWIHRGALLFQGLLGALLFFSLTFFSSRTYSRMHAKLPSSVPLYGVWSVDEFTVSGTPARSVFTPKMLNDLKIPAAKDRWERLIIQSEHSAIIQLSNGSLNYFTPSIDMKNNSLSLADSDDAGWQCRLAMQNAEPGQLQLQGTVNGLSVSAKLHREDQTRFLLVTQSFRWIQEHPDYR